MIESPNEVQRLVDCLGTPAYTCEHGVIFQGDCLELLSKLPDSLIPLVVTSPPYNIGKEYETPLELADYLDWSERWIREVHRIATRSGAFWLNLGYVSVADKGRAVPLAYLLWDRTPFYLLQEIVWHYAAGVSTRRAFAPRNEKFLWFVKSYLDYVFNLDAVRDPDVKYPLQKKNGKLKCNPAGKNPSDVWQFAKVTSGKDRASPERTPHPAQFPIAVIQRILLATSAPGDLILDPFMGSGSVGEVAIRTGRQFVGFEIRGDYVEIAAKRIEGVYRQQQIDRLQQPLFHAI